MTGTQDGDDSDRTITIHGVVARAPALNIGCH